LASFSVVLIGLGALASLLAPWPLKILIDSVLQDHPLSPVLAFLVGPLEHNRVGLMLNVRKADLENVLAALPALRNPTVAQLSDREWVAINTIIEEKTARQIIPKLKAARAEGIVEYPLNKVVY